MKIPKNLLANFAILSLCLTLPAQAAQKAVAVAPETLAASHEAVANMQLISVFIVAAKSAFGKGDWAKLLKKSETTQMNKLFEDEANKAKPRIIDRIASVEAKKFTAEQIKDILALTKGTYFQKLISTSVSGQPAPPESELPDSEREVFERVGNSDYFKTFQADVTSDNGNMTRDLTTLIKRAYAKLKKK